MFCESRMEVNFITMTGICNDCRKEQADRKCFSEECELKMIEEEEWN